jgi:hypothetical protein
MMSKPCRAFRSHLQASKYLGRDVRTIRRYEGLLYTIDKTLPNPQAKKVPCKVCGRICRAAENRRGYCPNCSKAGEGRKAQARILAESYIGDNNPNYVDGGVKQTFRHRGPGREWSEAVRRRDGACRCCGRRGHLQAHHVLPVVLFPEHCLEANNGITLCGHHHTELHRLRLDLRLLPTLYGSSMDGLPLHEALCRQPEFRALRLLPWRPYDRHELLRAAPKNYRRLVQDLHPGFARRVLGLPA